MQSPGTCLTAEGALLMAGAADGAVLSYDLRTPARLLSVIQTHRHPVVGILLQPGNTSNLVVTGSVNGEMKFCDLRNAAKPFFTAEVCPKPQSTAGGGALGGGSNAGGGGSTTARPPQGHALTRARRAPRTRASSRRARASARSSSGTWKATTSRRFGIGTPCWGNASAPFDRSRFIRTVCCSCRGRTTRPRRCTAARAPGTESCGTSERERFSLYL